jgi:hypothetical protein
LVFPASGRVTLLTANGVPISSGKGFSYKSMTYGNGGIENTSLKCKLPYTLQVK